MTNSQPTYPPSIPGSLQAVDPQLLAALENMVQSKMNETEQAYCRELQACDEAWQRCEQEFQAHEVAFQAKLRDLSDELEAVKSWSVICSQLVSGCTVTVLSRFKGRVRQMEDKSGVQSESNFRVSRQEVRGFQREWDCGLNIYVVPPCIHMSLFTR